MKKRKNVFATITLVSVFLFLSFIPFMHTLNYSGFEALGVSISPSQKYIINYDLPHIKPVNASVREKARKSLCKTFGISSSNENGKYDITKPMVFLFKSPISNKYYGNIEIGNIKANFTKIKVISEEKQTSEQNPKGKDLPPSKVLLTCYFTLNEKPLRANIFLMNGGSFLRYSSMTIQDKNDNVLAMFTFGKALNKNSETNAKKPALSNKTSGISATYSDEDSFNWIRKGNSIKYIGIADPFTGAVSYVPAIRQDVLAKYPFIAPNERLGVRLRTWTFQKDIGNVYKEFYANQYGSGWASVGIYDMENSYNFRFSTDLLNCGFYPQEKDFNDNTPLLLNIAFNLIKSLTPYLRVIPINFSVKVESGYEIKWNFGNNYAYVSARAEYPLSGDTFSYGWNKSIEWPGSDYEANYLENPDSSYKGFVSKILFWLAGNSSSYYGDFSGYSYYVVEAGSNALYQIYYLSCSTNERYVRLTR